MSAPPREIPRSAALAMQGAIAREHRGSARLRSPGALESALATVDELVAFGEQDAFELAAALFQHMVAELGLEKTRVAAALQTDLARSGALHLPNWLRTP